MKRPTLFAGVVRVLLVAMMFTILGSGLVQAQTAEVTWPEDSKTITIWPGSSGHFTVTVTNPAIGPVPGPYTIVLSNPTGTVPANFSLSVPDWEFPPSLDPGDTFTVRYDYTAGSGAQPGLYEVHLYVDYQEYYPLPLPPSFGDPVTIEADPWIRVPRDPEGAPVFPSIYIGIGAALGAGVLAYLLRRKMVAGQFSI
jgi:hypothetical protein